MKGEGGWRKKGGGGKEGRLLGLAQTLRVMVGSEGSNILDPTVHLKQKGGREVTRREEDEEGGGEGGEGRREDVRVSAPLVVLNVKGLGREGKGGLRVI
jgi:hypothetical protein